MNPVLILLELKTKYLNLPLKSCPCMYVWSMSFKLYKFNLFFFFPFGRLVYSNNIFMWPL